MAIYSFRANQAWQAQQVMNVLHYESDDPLSGAQLQECADDYRASYVAQAPLSQMDDAWSLTSVTIRRVDLAELPEADFNFTLGALVGASTNLPVPTQVSALVSGSAPTVFPRRVRTYYAGLVGSAMSQSGALISVVVVAFQDLAEATDILAATGGELRRVAVEYGLTPPRVVAFNRITSYAASFNPAIQRRRRLAQGI